MLLVIPTFRRIDRLHWTLQSLLHNQKPDSTASFRVVIANNYPPLSGEVENLIRDVRSKYEGFDFWEWIIVHREKTVDAAKNCLSAIQDYAEPDEAIIVQGDDDLFMPWSIKDRVDAIEKESADILLTKSNYSLWYLDEQGRIYFSEKLAAHSKSAFCEELGWADINEWGAVFLGNNCYRYTEKFQKGLDLTFQWFDRQHWLDFNTSSHMWPFYLPYAVKLFAGSVKGLNQHCVIRGNLLEERAKDKFEVSFNTGLLSLCALGVLQNEDLGKIKELDETRRLMGEYIFEWIFPLFLDRRVSRTIRKDTLKHIPLPLKYATTASIIRGLKRVVKSYLGVQLLSTRIRARNSRTTVDELIQEMISLSN